MIAMWIILEKLLEVKLYAKLEKCEFHESKIASLEMAFTWILTSFKPLLVGLL
jgi:hypothetical protein